MGFSPRKLIWKLFELLPGAIKHKLIRDSIDIDESQLAGIEIRVARDQQEINQAFKLLYEAYLGNGLMDPKEHELRITKYHCLPTSIIVVAIYEGEVIGTVTHVLDSQLGLPSDSAVDLTSFRKRGKRIAEISALAVKKGFRRSHALLFAMTRYMFYYATKYAGVNYWIIGVRSNVATYYQGLFFFNRFKTKKIAHNFVKNSPSYFLYANLNELDALFLKHYSNKPDNKNMYKFYRQKKLQEIGNFDQFKFNLPINYCYDKESFENYFREKEKIIESLNQTEKFEVLNAYKEIYPEFFEASEVELLTSKHIRNGVRYISFYEIEILRNINNQDNSITLNKEFVSNGHMLNFSKTGFLLKTNQKLNIDESYLIRFPMKYPIERMVSFRVVGDLKNNMYSGVILNNPMPWTNFINQIELHFHKQVQQDTVDSIKESA
jgi:hypothetical protein